jgi:hypothetical protein
MPLFAQQLENPMTTNFPAFQSLYHLLHGIISNAKLHCNHHPSVFSDEHISFLLITFCGDCSWSNAARQIGDALLTISEAFAQLYTLLVPMKESP